MQDHKNSSILATSKGAKTNDDSQEKSSNNNNKNSLKFNVINKRAIFLFFLIGILLKPVIHFTMFPETEEYVNYEIEIPINNRSYLNSLSEEDILAKVGGKAIYFDKDSITDDNTGKKYSIDDIQNERIGVNDNGLIIYRIYYNPKQTTTLSFQTHLQNLFMQKLWIFAISIILSMLIVWFFYPVIENKKT